MLVKLGFGFGEEGAFVGFGGGNFGAEAAVELAVFIVGG